MMALGSKKLWLIVSVILLSVISYFAYRFTSRRDINAQANIQLKKSLSSAEENCRSESARVLAAAENLSNYALTLPNGGASPEMTSEMRQDMEAKINVELKQLKSAFELAALARICRAMFVLKVDSCAPFGGVFDVAFWKCVKLISEMDADDRNLEPLYRSANLGEPEHEIFKEYMDSQKRRMENKNVPK